MVTFVNQLEKDVADTRAELQRQLALTNENLTLAYRSAVDDARNMLSDAAAHNSQQFEVHTANFDSKLQAMRGEAAHLVAMKADALRADTTQEINGQAAKLMGHISTAAQQAASMARAHTDSTLDLHAAKSEAALQSVVQQMQHTLSEEASAVKTLVLRHTNDALEHVADQHRNAAAAITAHSEAVAHAAAESTRQDMEQRLAVHQAASMTEHVKTRALASENGHRAFVAGVNLTTRTVQACFDHFGLLTALRLRSKCHCVPC